MDFQSCSVQAITKTEEKHNHREKIIYIFFVVVCLVIKLCLILCNPMDCSPPGFSVHEDSPGKNTEVGCHAFLREPSQHWEDPLHCRQVLYRLSHQCISYKGGCAYSVNIVTLSISTCTQAHEMRDRICMLCPISHTS